VTVLLFPGAGSDSSHPSLVAIERALAPHRVVRADFPYRLAGRQAPDRTPVLLAAVREQIAALPDDEPLVLGGRSMGGRMCSMIAAGADDEAPPRNLAGLVLICYPLHPPGKPDNLRVEHLPDIAVPTLFISGDRDQFGSPGELRHWTATMSPRARGRGGVEHLFLEGRDHALKHADHTIAGAVKDFCARLRL
jgi:predicted alpha/beta-hydrolase family hydrolase